MVRKHLYYRGHVQGVGFRYTTRQIAAGFAVTGFVRNLPDGRVEVVAEGAAQEVAAFVERLGEQMGGYIREVKSVNEPATGTYDRFDVAF